MKKIKGILLVLIFALSMSLCGCQNDNVSEKKIEIVTTNFPCYDIARAITNGDDNINLTMLLKPGVESHNFDPTPQDILLVQNCDLFIYTGGESDVWVDKILESSDKEINAVKLCDFVPLLVEEFKEGMEEEHEDEDADEEVEYDEHVWTSPSNMITLIDGIKTIIIELDETKEELYLNNAKEYISKIESLRDEFNQVVFDSKAKSSNVTKPLIFGDRFPLIYFVKEFGLDYYAAFPGCSSETEASAKTILFLIDMIKEKEIKYVFHIELSAEKVCDTLKEETGVETLLFHTAHNVSKEEFESGETYYSLMHKNIENLELALN
ncbi:MAG: metal ABC transporter substrate-binding protein [Clostridia bacterium]|nr:metal ABC transporter substrate-binding protein [Clostridia bacterium]